MASDDRTATDLATEWLRGVLDKKVIHTDELAGIQTAVLAALAEQLTTVGVLLERLAFPATYIIGPEGADRLRSGSVNLLADPVPPHQRVDGYVWCDEHGCIHEASTDPYDAGEDCYGHHRPVFTTPDDPLPRSGLFDHLDGCTYTTDLGWQCRPACPSRAKADDDGK